MATKKKPRKKPNPSVAPTRKQLRKQARKQKKARRQEHYENRKNRVANSDKSENDGAGVEKIETTNRPENRDAQETFSCEKARENEKKQQAKLQKEMTKRRKAQLMQANEEEDHTIKKLEKQLKLNKRKSKSIPQSFSVDGLDYLLEVCDSSTIGSVVMAEQQLNEANVDFEEDLVLMTAESAQKPTERNRKKISGGKVETDEDLDGVETDNDESDVSLADSDDSVADSDGDDEDLDGTDDDSDGSDKGLGDTKTDSSDLDLNLVGSKRNRTGKKSTVATVKKRGSSDSASDTEKGTNKRKKKTESRKEKKFKKSQDLDIDFSENGEDAEENEEQLDEEAREDFDSDSTDDSGDKNTNKRKRKTESGTIKFDKSRQDLNQQQSDDFSESNDELGEETWEDIYGRLRKKDGSVATETNKKYVPPALRIKNDAEDKKRLEKLSRLNRQLKGLLNRLAENNMHTIATQMEDLYMNNSRNDMNSALTNLILEALVSHVLAPERLLVEHVVLITILHANVGTEVGAHFLQTVVKQFDEIFNKDKTENKKIDNLCNIIAQLYNFKLLNSKLIFEILNKLSKRFEEKDVECILHILRNVGFNLRKDDPIALKNLIMSLQSFASTANQHKNNPRVKFMLDILLAIKNNNVAKIPNYDTSYPEHLKKITRGFVRKGNQVAQLNVSFEDLLKVEERGRWWVVGSAWKGEDQTDKTAKNETDRFSDELLRLARKQRMNTDARRNIFCVMMSAEDYLDAFEKILRLDLKNQQDREIIHVLLHCCIQEKSYNPYYAVLAQKFCEHARKYQMTVKYSVWDKLKVLGEHSGNQISNLAKLLSHLFISKALSISVLKIVQFGELDKVNLRFIRQILLGILLHERAEVVQGVFENVAKSDKLKMFRESLKLFVRHFLLQNLKSDGVPKEQKELLEKRAKFVEKLLSKKQPTLDYTEL